MENRVFHRREFIRKFIENSILFFGGAFFLTACNPKKSGQSPARSHKVESCDDLSGVSKEELLKREKFGYVKESPVPGSHCGNCSLYIPPGTESPCGHCLLFKGPVHPTGYCTQYAAKVEAAID